jgi:preprotein translocase subunit SecA
MIGNLLTKIFGSKSDKDIKEVEPIVKEINNYYKEFDKLSEVELKAKTDEFKEIIRENVRELEDEREQIIESLRTEALGADKITDMNSRLKTIGNDLHTETEAILNEILPEAFAVVKQACNRLRENKHAYKYADEQYIWDMVPYDVQLIGGVVLHNGRISEMATGEGKTLVAVMPLYLNALAGRGSHLVTVNDYLARRDAEWMAPVYEYLGLTVGSIQSKMDHDERKKIYNMDISYGTNNEFGFDYLRDNMVVDADQMVQREHWYAIVDEVDSVLVDEARTPLIISGPVGQGEHQFDDMNPRVQKLVQSQSKLVTGFVAEATTLLKSEKKEDIEEGGVKLLLAYRGYPKHKRLMKLLQDAQNMKLLKDSELFYLGDKGRKMKEVDEQLYYVIEERQHSIDITEIGRNMLIKGNEDPEMFVIPDITTILSDLEVDTSIDEKEKQTQKDEIHQLFAERSDTIHTLNQLLRAYSLYEKDVDYVVQGGKIMIVDEHTGRILDGRRYSEGLHQAIEAKEKVKVEGDTQTYATITLQNYFRLYKKLAGMTGTAETEAAEFEKIYKLDTVVIPTNRPITRDDQDDLIYRTTREKYNALAEHVEQLLKDGRAVLVGTATVEVSELLSKMFKRKGIKHNVLNAKQHQKEADIVRNAGKNGSVTIATNMAGRGTDIKIDSHVKKSGGLAIVGSERHDSRRIDRQLRGRAGRQGDPGSSVFFISLEDKLMRLFGGDRVSGIMQKMKVPEGEPIQHSMMTKSVERAQKKVEENNFGIRKRLIDYDDVMNQQREVIYSRRRQALRGERLKGEIFEYVEDLVAAWYDEFHPNNDLEGFKNACRASLLCDPDVDEKGFDGMSQPKAIKLVMDAAEKFYARKEEMFGVEFMGKLERYATLQKIDDKWRDHLRMMDDIKEGIHLRSYGQKDPILEYKGEAYRHFVKLLQEINGEIVEFSFKYFPKAIERRPSAQEVAAKEAQERQRVLPELKNVSIMNSPSLQFQHASETPAMVQGGGGQQQMQAQGAESQPKVKTFVRTDKRINRNDTVKVQYEDGSIREAKYKKVQADVESGIAHVID